MSVGSRGSKGWHTSRSVFTEMSPNDQNDRMTLQEDSLIMQVTYGGRHLRSSNVRSGVSCKGRLVYGPIGSAGNAGLWPQNQALRKETAFCPCLTHVRSTDMSMD